MNQIQMIFTIKGGLIIIPQNDSPDDVIVVSQIKLLGVFSGVVNHPNSGHEVDDLLPSGVVQVIPALVAPVSMNPLQSQLAARGRLICHALWASDGL